MQKSQGFRGLRPLDPHQGSALDPLGDLQRPLDPQLLLQRPMVIAHRAFGTISFYILHPLNPTGKISNPTGNLSNPTNISSTPSTLQQPQQHTRITPLKSNAFNGDVTGGRVQVSYKRVSYKKIV